MSKAIDFSQVNPTAVLSFQSLACPKAMRLWYVLIKEREGVFEYFSDKSRVLDNLYVQYRAEVLVAAKSKIGDAQPIRTLATKEQIAQVYDLCAKAAGGAAGTGMDSVSDPEFEKAKRYFTELLSLAKKNKVTDVHICVRRTSARILFRELGEMSPGRSDEPKLVTGIIASMYNVGADNSSRSHASFSSKTACLCTLSLKDLQLRIRWQTVPTTSEEEFDVIMRLIPDSVDEAEKTFTQLGYLPSQVRLLDIIARTPQGGTFIAGITGSGKSTTLRTMMSLAKDSGSKKIYTVEDPVEYKIYGATQIQVQRQDGGVNPYPGILKMLMRSDPDIIMLGEVRDADTACGVVDIVRSGQGLYTTVHAASAIGIVGRLVDIGIEKPVFGEPGFLSGLIYQHLLPTLCTHCATPFDDVTENDIGDLDSKQIDIEMIRRDGYMRMRNNMYRLDIPTEFIKLRDRNGCNHCRGGKTGMTVAAEVIMPDDDMCTLLGEGRIMEALKYYRGRRTENFCSADCTGKTAFEAGLHKVAVGMIDPFDLQSLFGAKTMETSTL